MNFGHLEVLHSKFHDPTISNLGDQSGQTNTQTNKQTDNANYYVDLESMDEFKNNLHITFFCHTLTLKTLLPCTYLASRIPFEMVLLLM